MVVENLNKINLWSNYDDKSINDGAERDEENNSPDDFLLPGSVCAIAADDKSIDTVWFVHIIGEFVTMLLMTMVILLQLARNICYIKFMNKSLKRHTNWYTRRKQFSTERA